MTENEAIERIKEQACNDRFLSIHCDDSCLYGAEKCEWAYAIQALEEIQQYRAIGTVEEITKLINFLSCDDDTSIIEDLRMLAEYYAIGTVDEFKVMKEKNEPKKVVDKIMYLECPSCGDVGILDCGYCSVCGQKLDWE